MSGFGGLLALGDQLPEAAALSRMADALVHRGRDAAGAVMDGPIGLCHSHLWTTPEDRGERQPLASRCGGYRLVADARIDNRDELLHLVDASESRRGSAASDAELILGAYRKWGEGCAEHLVGDFSFVVWDAIERRMFAARDVSGLRQLYFGSFQGFLFFSNSLAALLAALPAKPAHNREFITEFLAGDHRRWATETVYRGVERLPVAHTMTVTAGRIRQRQYWLGGEPPRGVPRTDAEWVEAFRAQLATAVRARLRSTTPVGLLLGGLDSSSIACTAHAMRRADASLPPLRMYSAVFDETPGADEREYIREVVAACPDFTWTPIPSDENWPLRSLPPAEDHPLAEPEIIPLRRHLAALIAAPAADGCRVVLTGNGANQVLGHTVYSRPIALRGLGVGDLLEELPFFKRHTRLSYAALLLHAYGAPWLHERLRCLLARLASPGLPRAPWVSDNRLRGNRRPSSERRTFLVPAWASPSAKAAFRALRSPFDLGCYAWLDDLASSAGVELRHPFLDRRLVELLLAVPHSLRSWRGTDRVVLRSAMAGVVPERVRHRLDKSHIKELYLRGLREGEHPRLAQLIAQPVAAHLGYLDARPLARSFESLSKAPHRDWPRLVSAFALEVWLRQGSRPTVDSAVGEEAHET